MIQPEVGFQPGDVMESEDLTSPTPTLRDQSVPQAQEQQPQIQQSEGFSLKYFRHTKLDERGYDIISDDYDDMDVMKDPVIRLAK